MQRRLSSYQRLPVVAIGLFYDGHQDGQGANQQPLQPVAPSKPEMPAEWKQLSKQKPKFRTMGQLAEGDPDDDEDDKMRYTSNDGVSSHQTIDPEKKKTKDDLMENLMRKAHENAQKKGGAHDYSDDDSDDPPKDKKQKADPNAWMLGGQSTGKKDDPPQQAQDKTKAQTQQKQLPEDLFEGFQPQKEKIDKQKLKVQLTLYKDAFTCDDGAPHYTNTPEGHAQLEEIEKGYYPRSLMPPGFKGHVDVVVKDKRDENAPKPPRDYFSEPGNTIGSGPTQSAVQPKQQQFKPEEKQKEKEKDLPPQKAISDLSEGTFMDNRTNRFVVKESDTLAVLEKMILQFLNARKVEISQPFPRKVYDKATDYNMRLTDLQLKNASVIVKVL
ncbi:MAG: hypothetical protein EZS28_024858 [Streblomastix strix]|uniref:SEP domain-containing protein n=1 Tax=Streblomastix strix TaxID=222440 RepID=A0A5J4VAU6_9EUKA|nr:MAG: hypothetical protein EZS28_024858 [Streblomastix strix]